MELVISFEALGGDDVASFAIRVFEERDVRGLAGAANSVNYDEAEVRTKAEDDAEDAAASRRTWAMVRATAGSLAAALLFVGLPGLLRARRKSEFEVLEEAALGEEKA